MLRDGIVIYSIKRSKRLFTRFLKMTKNILISPSPLPFSFVPSPFPFVPSLTLFPLPHYKKTQSSKSATTHSGILSTPSALTAQTGRASKRPCQTFRLPLGWCVSAFFRPRSKSVR